MACISDRSSHVGSMDQGPLVCTVYRARDDGYAASVALPTKKIAYALLEISAPE